MNHPYQRLSPASMRRIFILLALATLAIMVILNLISAPLTTDAAPMGIISYELARSVAGAEGILNSWDAAAQLHAAFALGFDYVFMLAYASSIGLACVLSSCVLRSRGWPLAGAGAALAWGLWAAAGLDAVENLALTAMLFSGVSVPWPQVAYWCALVKFALVFLGLVYAFYGGVVRLFIRQVPAI